MTDYQNDTEAFDRFVNTGNIVYKGYTFKDGLLDGEVDVTRPDGTVETVKHIGHAIDLINEES